MNEHAAPSAYPLRLEGKLDAPLSRWLWLVKWVLVIPHFIVLVFLWIAFVVADRRRVLRDPVHRPLPARRSSTSTSACCAGPGASASTPTARSAPTATRRSRSPTCRTTRRGSRSSYPQALSRGLVLVKWWLLALPQYLIVAVFAGGAWAGLRRGERQRLDVELRRRPDRPAGLHRRASCCCSPAATRGSIFDFVMGMNRWVLPRRRLRDADDRRVPAVPPRHGRARAGAGQRRGDRGRARPRARAFVRGVGCRSGWPCGQQSRPKRAVRRRSDKRDEVAH